MSSSERNIVIECQFYLPSDDITAGRGGLPCRAHSEPADWIAPSLQAAQAKLNLARPNLMRRRGFMGLEARAAS